MKILFAFGSRACAIKMAPLVKEAKNRGIEHVIVWSGQHYDDNLYKKLFEDLGLPKPHYDIEAKGSALEMGAKILVEFGAICQIEAPDVVLTHGDTFSAMYFSQAAALTLTPVAHVEAGLRTYSWEPYPEQICTKTADACSSLFFASTQRNVNDLLDEHVPEDRIFLVGNTVVDVLIQHLDRALESKITETLGMRKPFVFWSCHRKENLLSEERMKGIFDALLETTDINFFCSILPSTQAAAEKYGYADRLKNAHHITWVECLPEYTDALKLMIDSALVLTDSGGMQEECAALHIPCLTLRYVTDRPESVEAGGNKCVGCKKETIMRETRMVVNVKDVQDKMRSAINPYGNGKTSKMILDVLEMHDGQFDRWERC